MGGRFGWQWTRGRPRKEPVLNQLTSITDSATGQFAFGYDGLGRRTALNRPNGVNTSYGYNSLSRLLCRSGVGDDVKVKKMKNNLALLFVVLILGCNAAAPPKDVLDELIQKQRRDHMGIGWVDGQKLELIEFGTKPTLRDYTLSVEEVQKLSAKSRTGEKPPKVEGGSDIQRSPNGKWITYRTQEKKFVLADASGRVQRALLADNRILTALYWSPDSEYLMYVAKSGKWDTGCLRYAEDGRDIIVYRLRDGQQGRVYQVCQGYPYTRFDWLTVPSDLSS
jgi:YD repeat-containing protein